ncbi:MAG TPA: DNA-binding protein WhiA [Thermoanaerobacterales bacterium]|nr:DNA-binding protein WhiA [Thermoanaerobacterales bacterium]
MLFSSRVKMELASIKSENRCCQYACLSSVIRMVGSIEIKGSNKFNLKIVTRNGYLIRHTFRTIKKLFDIVPKLMVKKTKRLKKNNIYILLIESSSDTKEILKALNILHFNPNMGFYINYGIDKNTVKNHCCKRAYLRCAFLGGGSITDPGKTYHLEFTCSNYKFAKDLSMLINSFGLKSKIIERKKYFMVYLKESEQISHMLNVMGAHSSLLEMENIRVIKGVRNTVNRLVNCDTANLNKTINASIRQVENIKLIEKKVGLKKLSKPLREIAELRLQFPDVSIKELGEMLQPPISKSGANHRLRKINYIATEIKKAGNS